MTRDEAIAVLDDCDQYLRLSKRWVGDAEQQAAFIVLDGVYTVEQLEAFALIMRNEPELFKRKESSE